MFLVGARIACRIVFLLLLFVNASDSLPRSLRDSLRESEEDKSQGGWQQEQGRRLDDNFPAQAGKT